MTTLEEAVANGRGTERPFRCHVHDDSSASASVNVVKNVWYCFACKAKGVVDGTRVPTTDELMAMLEPETVGREYPSSWLEVFGHGGYWLDRFPEWLAWYHGLGEDPWTGEATFPVHTPRGRLAGVGRRAVIAGPGPKYRYPYAWSAARTLFGSRGIWKGPKTGVITLVEGAADACALWEVGIPAWAVYGAGIHHPQVELIHQLQPKLVLLGFDMDDAGARACEQTEKALSELETAAITWPDKDPADTEKGARLEAVIQAVGGSGYRHPAEVEKHAESVVKTLTNAFKEAA